MEDMVKLLDYCDVQMYGAEWNRQHTRPEQLKTCVYDGQ